MSSHFLVITSIPDLTDTLPESHLSRQRAARESEIR